jgi:hypothetical protein
MKIPVLTDALFDGMRRMTRGAGGRRLRTMRRIQLAMGGVDRVDGVENLIRRRALDRAIGSSGGCSLREAG